MIVTISGRAGSGKSTIGRLLAKKLGYNFYSIGSLRREMASKMGLTIQEFNKLGESEDFTDKQVDDYQKALGEKEDNFVLDGRLGFYFIPHSIKIFLDADLEVRAKRLFESYRKKEHYKSINDAIKAIEEREASDTRRYKKYYNIDCYDKSHYDLVVDTTDSPIKQNLDKILKFLKKDRKV